MSDLYRAPPGHLLLQLASHRTAAYLCEADPRASYYLYVPTTHPVSRRAAGEDTMGEGTLLFPLVVLVHGSGRDAQGLRDRWSEFAEHNRCVLLAPLFPADYPDGCDNYKLIAYDSPVHGPVRYDHLLLDMVDTVSRVWGFIETRQFCLSGFSGGGQFAHRFWYLHPERIRAVSIGAPGNATLLQAGSWPRGISDAPTRFDTDISRAALASTAVQLVVGGADTYRPVSSNGTPAKLSRLEVMMALSENYSSLGIKHQLHVRPSVKHQEVMLQDEAEAFIGANLKLRSAKQADTKALQKTASTLRPAMLDLPLALTA